MKVSKTRVRQAGHRSLRILEAARELFCEKGIEETSIEDVAKKSQVGPATVYRYFETKAELAIACGIAYWQKVAAKYLDILAGQEYKELDGMHQLAEIIGIFVRIFEEEFLFLKFLQEFDVFVRRYQIGQERLEEYETCILNLKPYVTKALEKGLQDGSLCFSYTVEEVYFSLTHTMLSLMQKLAYNGSILSSDERVGLALQIRIAGDLLLRGLADSRKVL